MSTYTFLETLKSACFGAVFIYLLFGLVAGIGTIFDRRFIYMGNKERALIFFVTILAWPLPLFRIR